MSETPAIPIFEDELAPANGEELVNRLSVEAVWGLLPPANQAFLEATNEETARQVQDHFGALLERADAYERADRRIPASLMTDLETADDAVLLLPQRYRQNLIDHIDHGQVRYPDGTQGRLFNYLVDGLGYSTPAQEARTTDVARSRGPRSGGGGRRSGGNGGGTSSKRHPLGSTSGNGRSRGR